MNNLLLILVLFVVGCAEIERMGLAEEKKEWRNYHLKNKVKITQKCRALKYRYTPNNFNPPDNQPPEIEESVIDSNPILSVYFYGNNSRSTCSVNIGFKNPQFSFSKRISVGERIKLYYEDYFCRSNDNDAKIESC